MIHFRNERVTIFQSALQQTNSTVIDHEELVLVVDPAWLPEEVEMIRAHVRGLARGKPVYLLFTHSDFDHVLGFGSFPDAQVIASRALRDHPQKGEVVAQIRDWDNKNYVRRPYAIEYPRVDHAIPPDDPGLLLGQARLAIAPAPGHNPDGIFTLLEPDGIWLTGDYLSDFELPFIYDSCEKYEQTLGLAARWLKEKRIRLLVPGHGRATADNAEIERRIRVARDYLDRLRQAIKAGDERILGKMAEEFQFPSGFTRGCHEGNIAILRRELGLGKN